MWVRAIIWKFKELGMRSVRRMNWKYVYLSFLFTALFSLNFYFMSICTNID